MTLPAVALLHGWGGAFASTFERFGWRQRLEATGRAVIAVDLPGHADPNAAIDPMAYRDMASLLDATLPNSPLDVVGYSLGGKLALELACRAPSRFRRMVIAGVGDNVFAPEPSGEAVAGALEHGVAANTPAPVAAFVEYSLASKSRNLALAAVLRRPPNPVAIPARLRAIASPILLVNGDQDALAQPDTQLLNALSRVEHRILHGVEHIELPENTRLQEMTVYFLNGTKIPADTSLIMF